MSILERKNFLYEDDEQYKEYKLPRLVTTKPEVIPIRKSFAISTALHPGVVLLIWLITTALALLGIQLFTFKKPDAKLKKDIEFVLVDKEAMPKNKNTKYRADINSRTGGINDPKKNVSMPSPAPKKVTKPSSAAASANKLIKKQQQVAQQKAVQQKTKVQQQQTKSQQPSSVSKPSPAKPAPPTARPSTNPTASPVPVAKPSSAFTIPKPVNAPTGKSLATGPVGGTSAPVGTSKGGTGNGVQAGYLGYWDAKALIKANTTSKFTPFWFTPDSIYVCGTKTRTISFNNGKVGTGGMRVADAANATPFPILE